MLNETNTPRTDEEVNKNNGKVMSVSSQFARQLELETIQLKQELEEVSKLVQPNGMFVCDRRK